MKLGSLHNFISLLSTGCVTKNNSGLKIEVRMMPQ